MLHHVMSVGCHPSMASFGGNNGPWITSFENADHHFDGFYLFLRKQR